jgi:hypothetical protein
MIGTRRWCAAALFAWVGAAQAFALTAKSESPLIDEASLRARTQALAAEIGARIPDDPKVKVYVYTRAQATPGAPQHYIYLHRVELRRAFNAQTPPYPYAGFLPIETVERYGVGDAQQARAALDQALRTFLERLKNVDPSKPLE